MGKGISNIMGGLGDSAQPQYSNKNQVNGTGQTVGDLRKIGYSDADLDQLGAKRNSPSDLQQGLGQGIAMGGNAYDQSAQKAGLKGGGQQIEQTPTPTNIAMSDPNYLNAAKAQWNPKSFYGRG